MSDRWGASGWRRFAKTVLRGVVRWGLRGLWRALTRLEIEGMEAVPESGPFLAAMNHLALVDSSLVFCFVSRVTVHMVHQEWKNWFSKYVYNGIFVADDSTEAHAVDRAIAVAAALKALCGGAGVLIAPEGRRSPAGTMQRGRPGVAHLAVLSRAPVVPVAMFGQEKLVDSWKRLRRAPVRLRVGNPIEPPAVEPSEERMQAFTDRVMAELARLLPHGYRGVYASAAAAGGSR